MRIPVLMILASLCACGNNGAPPYPPETAAATPSKAGSSTATSAATAPGPTSAALRAPAGPPPPAAVDPRVAYELREKCGQDARLWYQHLQENGGPAQESTSRGFTSHYNAKTNDCFALTSASNGRTEQRKLTDVLENHDIGTISYDSDSAKPIECHVAGRVCQSQQEWATLTAPYMND
jgi:predicted small lipoprotein YifL